MNHANSEQIVSATCPYCEKSLDYPAVFVGKSCPCPHCRAEITLCDAPVHPINVGAEPVVRAARQPHSRSIVTLFRLLKPSTINAASVICRWILLLPGAIIAAVACGGMILILLGTSSYFFGLELKINKILSGFVSGYVLILVAAWIAPSERKTVPAFVVAILMFLLAGGSILIRIANHDWMKLLYDVAIVVGTAVALVQEIKEDLP